MAHDTPGAEGGSGGGADGTGSDIGWADTVRFRLPPGWAVDVEEHEGQPVGTFRPPPPAAGVLRLVTDRVVPRPDSGGVAGTLREMAVRFVRPQDPRAGDRSVESRADGAVIAQAMMRTLEDGRAETHYLWLIGADRSDDAAVAMFSFALPGLMDGDESCAEMLGRIDDAIRNAEIL
ncbi:hypothetical protein VY88_08365 [Azospirillum thiophilum]|uniref:Uncharacterized protein n=1 Tax=Azospirillum thiophilum TaxID=528244 RepID=A0AAC9EX54_9PROT|nr:hypothetical protein [Azospirillum thiophilum]ALG70271.1 hypothetical protein AL072_04345 [Azospirillum thiophilum]KJR66053.1 hypothetical protein VY88_08365 [Azospirillum thiophilum]